MKTTLAQRKGDMIFVLMLLFFVFTSFCIDLPKALSILFGVPVPAGLQALVADYQIHTDPVFAVMPPYLLAALSLSAFLWGPLYIYFIHGFITGNNRIRTPVLVYGGAMSAAMIVVMAESLFSNISGWRSPDPSGFVLVNIPYLLVPLALVWRMWPDEPFPSASSIPS